MIKSIEVLAQAIQTEFGTEIPPELVDELSLSIKVKYAVPTYWYGEHQFTCVCENETLSGEDFKAFIYEVIEELKTK